MSNPFRNECLQVAALRLETLATQKAKFDAGEFEFVEAIHRVLTDVSQSQLSLLPEQTLNTMINKVQRVKNELERIWRTAGEPNITVGGLTDLINQLRSDWDAFYLISSANIALVRLSSQAMHDQLNRLRGEIQRTCDEWQARSISLGEAQAKAAQQLEARLQEVEELKRQLKSDLAAKVASAQAREFEEEAIASADLADKWLLATVAILVIGITCTVILFLTEWGHNLLGGIGAQNTPLAWERTIARFAIVTFLYVGLLWSGRNYFASRHNYTVNRHRRNAMQTFRAFRESAQDPATQEFILSQAVACAFSPQQSGYLKEENLPVPPQLSETLRIPSGPKSV